MGRREPELSETLYTAADLQVSESRCSPGELRELGDLARKLEERAGLFSEKDVREAIEHALIHGDLVVLEGNADPTTNVPLPICKLTDEVVSYLEAQRIRRAKR